MFNYNEVYVFSLTWQNASKQLHSEKCQLKIPPIFVRSNISSHPWSQHGKNKVLRETAVSWESIDLSQFYLHPLLGWWAVSLISNDNTRLGPFFFIITVHDTANSLWAATEYEERKMVLSEIFCCSRVVGVLILSNGIILCCHPRWARGISFITPSLFALSECLAQIRWAVHKIWNKYVPCWRKTLNTKHRH